MPQSHFRRSYSPSTSRRAVERDRQRRLEEPIRRAQEAERELHRQKAMNREARRLGVRLPYPKAGT